MGIYLDNAATTQPLAGFEAEYSKYTKELWYNPSALYLPALSVEKMVQETREKLLKNFAADGYKCFFTAGGTEGANTVIFGGAKKKKNMNYVCGGAEHPCVLESFRMLEETGHDVRYIKPRPDGYIDAEDALALVDGNTALVSIVHVNNETGAKNDVARIAQMVKQKNAAALFHSDGVQAFLKEPVMRTEGIDYYTVSAHKLHALKGTGAVFYKSGAPLKPYLIGGGQEGGLRSGTQNTLGILSFAYAADYFTKHSHDISEKYKSLRRTLIDGCSRIEDAVLVSPKEEERACSHIVSLSFPGVAGETLMHTLEAKGIYISTGSACSSKKDKSRIRDALSLPGEVADGMVRVSFSFFNTEDEVWKTVEELEKNVKLLRKYKRS
ncbi:MAG: cysteine desulfurase family protein [Christensenellaceae bacterium]